MADPVWREVADGFEWGDYRILHLDHGARRWRLEISGTAGRERITAPATSDHRSLRQAKSSAAMHQRERDVKAIATFHLVVATAAAAAFVVILLRPTGLTGFTAAMVTFTVALRSLVNAIGVRLGDAWGWTRDSGVAETRRLERVALAVAAYFQRRAATRSSAGPPGSVRVLPPGPA